MLKRKAKSSGFRTKSSFDMDLKEGLYDVDDWQYGGDWDDDDSLGDDELHIPEVDTAAEEYLYKHHDRDTVDIPLVRPAYYCDYDKKFTKNKKSSKKSKRSSAESSVDDPKSFNLVSIKSANIQERKSDINDEWDVVESPVPKEGCSIEMEDFLHDAAIIEATGDAGTSLSTYKDSNGSSSMWVDQNVSSMDDLTPCDLNFSSTGLASILGNISVIYIESDGPSDGMESAAPKDGSDNETLEVINTGEFPLSDCQECTISFDTASISEKQLLETYGNNYIESRSMPRKFAIILDQSHLNDKTSNKQCFIIAECLKSNQLQQISDLNLKIFGYKCDIHEILRSVEESELQASFNVLTLIMRQSKALRMPPKTSDLEPNLLQDLTKWRPKAVTVTEACDLLIKELFIGVLTEENVAARDPCDVPVEIQPVTYTCGLCNQVMPEYNEATEGNAEIQLKECLHAYCKGCWKSYLVLKINETDSAHDIKCPALGCQAAVDMVTILSVVPPDDAFKHLKATFESKINESREWEWCPSCQRVAFCPGFTDNNLKTILADLPVVQCPCMSTWCFLCKNDGHWPAHCDDVVLYEKIQNEERKTIFQNNRVVTRLRYLIISCWRCQQPISEFMEFSCCSYMLCNQCESQFCWKTSRKPNRVHEEMCIEYHSIAHLFSAVDPTQVKRNGKMVRRAFMLRYHVYRLEKRKKQLRLDGKPRPTAETHSLLSKRKMVAHAIAVHKEASRMCEYVQLTRLKSTSKHYNGRLYRFTDTAEVLLNRVKDGINKRSQEIDMIEVESALAKLKAQMLTIKSLES